MERRPKAVIKEARRLRDATHSVLAVTEERRAKARERYEVARDEVVDRQLNEMPIARLRETTHGGVRWKALEAAGFRTVAQAASADPLQLQRIRGVGHHSATQVVAAARQLETAMREGVRLRFDAERKPRAQTKLLEELRSLEVAQDAVASVRGLDHFSRSLDRLVKKGGRAGSGFKMFFTRGKRRSEVLAAADELTRLMQSHEASSLDRAAREAKDGLKAKPPSGPVWDDFEKRVAAFNGLLIEIGGLSPDIGAVQGYIPTEVAERVNRHPLDTSELQVTLRGYQAFGAKFALCQKKAILGDEMGLGKTVEALAAIGHLHTGGETHFLVVCPASVLVNWLHETERHTSLEAFRLHGGDRNINFKAWARRGGIGVTTFGTLYTLPEPEGLKVALLVVDEAHYIKNPRAFRTQEVKDWIRTTNRTLFLTGTPMENRVSEFRTLVGHLNPIVASKLSAHDGLAGATAFRSAVAPVYLRRNQEDVLEELPPKIETEEWVGLEGEDLQAYLEAVASGNFMAMRQAAYLPGTKSGSRKLKRLGEIAEEAASGGRKIVVFSFFRQVLDAVAGSLDGLAMGPLTGSVSPNDRQRLVDEFTSRRGPAVLVSQIQAGGVGLNMQAASVVILTEPQWKKTTEDQAIARAHRMGQARPVDVHRLLAEDSVDERMLEILAQKQLLFDEYVRHSELKDVSPDAIDISDLKATKEVVSQAEAERRIVELEQRRLGFEPAAAGGKS